MDSYAQIAQSGRCYVLAPAGYGKTHLISQAVAQHASGRELILTHTHVGVDTIRRKLRELKAPSSAFHVDTIAGWALRYGTAYPSLSGLTTPKPQTADWRSVYLAAGVLLGHPHVRRVVQASYVGIYVDEYQDCTVEQHGLILKLAEILPCRIVGDPLQGIFGFGNNVLVNWEKDVTSQFEELPVLSTPWRWLKTCPKLGQWLTTIRRDIENGSPINLALAPRPHVRWVKLPAANPGRFLTQVEVCRNIPRDGHSTVAILNWERQCNTLVTNLAPMYCNIETIECEDLLESTAAIGASIGADRIDAVVKFLSGCFTGVRREIETVVRAAKKAQPTSRREYKHQNILTNLLAIADDSTFASVLSLLEAVKMVPGITLWRKELFLAMCQSIREYSGGSHATLQDAAWAVRNRTRRVGRRLGKRAVGRTLLVKGLEFDHCLVLDADSLKAKDLYVALTRATRSLTVLSKSQILKPLM